MFCLLSPKLPQVRHLLIRPPKRQKIRGATTVRPSGMDSDSRSHSPKAPMRNRSFEIRVGISSERYRINPEEGIQNSQKHPVPMLAETFVMGCDWKESFRLGVTKETTQHRSFPVVSFEDRKLAKVLLWTSESVLHDSPGIQRNTSWPGSVTVRDLCATMQRDVVWYRGYGFRNEIALGLSRLIWESGPKGLARDGNSRSTGQRR